MLKITKVFNKFINWLKVVILGMDDFYLGLLKKAAYVGIGIKVDISKDIKDHFLNNNNIPDHQYTTLDKNVELFLQSIAYEDFIKYDNNTPEINFANNTDCLDHIKASINITPKGILFYYEKRKVDGTVWANRLTMVFIFITLLIGALNLNIAKNNLDLLIKDDDYKEKLKSEQHQRQHTEHKLLLLQVKFDSLNRILHQTDTNHPKPTSKK